MSLSQKPYQLPGNTVALAFSDPASTNSCIAVYEISKATDRTPLPCLFSNRSYYPVSYKAVVSEGIPDFKRLKIDCLFTGTSHPESSEYYEVRCIKEAKRNGVYTISFIDHWINFKLRFEGLKTEELPDEIWVIDETARQLAIKEHLPAERLLVKGNPYHYYLKTYWKPFYKGKEYFKQLGISESGFTILFAPDPFSIRKGSSVTGFTESDALRSLMNVLKEITREICLVIKAHPLQPLEVLNEVLSSYPGANCKLIKEADNNELINASDLVIGFHSNLLLEAKALNKKVIRFFPGNVEADLLRNNAAMEKSCSNEDELRKKISEYIHE